MTDEQLKAAAIALCEIKGLDPHQQITVRVSGFEVSGIGELWEEFVPKIKEHEEIHEAVIRAIAGNGWSK